MAQPPSDSTDEQRADASPSEERESAVGSTRRGSLWRVIGGVVLLAALILLARQAGGYIPGFLEWVDSLGFWAPLAFILGYAVATVAFMPGSLLTLAGGAIFGLAEGTLWVFLGASLGATAAFLVARYVARGWVAKKVEANEKFAAIDSAVARQGLKITFLLRLSPIFPFNLLNYALGLTRVRLRDYVLACFGMLPGTVLYVYSGKVAGDVAKVAAGTGAAAERGWAYWLVLGIGLLATVAVTTYVTRLARRALKEVDELEDEVPDAA